MHRFGATQNDMRDIDNDDIFLLRLKILLIMAYAYLEGYPSGKFRETAISENANEIERDLMNWGGRIINSKTYNEAGNVSLDPLFYKRLKLLTVMMKGIADGHPMSQYREKALLMNADYISESIQFNRISVDIHLLKVT